MQCATRTTSGFTLIEILMVVAILGIAGALIVPQLGSRDDLKAAAAARVVMADLVYAQNLAITQQRNICVAFDLAARQYSLLTAGDMLPVQHPIDKRSYVQRWGSGGSAGLRNTDIVSAVFTAGASSSAILAFDEMGSPLAYIDGNPQALSSGQIVVQCAGFRLKVEIEPFTGQIKVSKTS